MSPSSSAARAPVRRAVSVRERARVSAIDERGVTVERTGASERIAARTVIWGAAGVQAAGFAATLAEATDASTDRAGRLEIDRSLKIPGHPEISAVGRTR